MDAITEYKKLADVMGWKGPYRVTVNGRVIADGLTLEKAKYLGRLYKGKVEQTGG